MNTGIKAAYEKNLLTVLQKNAPCDIIISNSKTTKGNIVNETH